jgi:pimeloyl-ACP methyl ester carboxylesterase
MNLSKYIPIKNGTIHYLELGEQNENHPPIILLHGWALDAFTFLPSLLLLSRYFRVIAPDLPGSGRSKCNIKNWDYENLGSMVIDFIESLGLKQFYLIGHSLGGGICIKVSYSIPEKIKGLILIDNSGIPKSRTGWKILMKLYEYPIQYGAQLLLGSLHNNFLIYKSYIYNCFHNFKSTIFSLKLPINEELESIAAHLRIKTLIVWGEKDETNYVDEAYVFLKIIKDSKLIIMNGNYYHEWHILYPEKFAKIVMEFIKSIEL